MKETYQQDQNAAMAEEADRQIATMRGDKESFPFFDEVQSDMAELLRTGRATSMVDAYRLAAFDKAKAEGRNDVIQKNKLKKVSVLPPAKKNIGKKEGAKNVFQEGKRSLRNILEDAFDEHGIELAEGEGD